MFWGTQRSFGFPGSGQTLGGHCVCAGVANTPGVRWPARLCSTLCAASVVTCGDWSATALVRVGSKALDHVAVELMVARLGGVRVA